MISALVDRANKRTVTLTPLDADGLAAWRTAATPAARAWLAGHAFTAASGGHLIVPGADGAPAEVLVGLDGAEVGLWDLADLPTKLPAGRYRLAGAPVAANAAALGWLLGGYRFGRYKTDGTAKAKAQAELVWPAGSDRPLVTAQAEGIALARDLINTPAGDLGPRELAAAARDLAGRHDAKCTVIAGKDLLKQGYPAVHAVGRAADNGPRLIDITWGKAKAPRVTLVGKGVCFDSGGLDIKPSGGMLLMKKDMGGAAQALALAHMIMALKLPVRLRVLIPAVENAISGNAFHPLDVLDTRKGLTVEVGNTDAEGRLILADALAEADRDRPEMILDFATLTGAARVALGTEVPAMFCNDEALAAALSAGRRRRQRPVLAPAAMGRLQTPSQIQGRRSVEHRQRRFRRGHHRGPVFGAFRLQGHALGAFRSDGLQPKQPAGPPGRRRGDERAGDFTPLADALSGRLVLAAEVDLVDRRLTGHDAVDVVGDLADRGFRIGLRRHMRPDFNARLVPKGMVLRQWFGAEDIQGGAGDLARLDRRQQIFLDNRRAAPGVDHETARRHGREHLGVHQIAGIARQRQQVDDNLARRQEIGEAVGAVVAGHPVEGFGAPAPAAHVETEPHQFGRQVAAQRAQSHDPDTPLGGVREGQFGPRLGGRDGGVFRPLAVIAQDMHQAPFAHRLGHPRVDDAQQRHIGRQVRIGENMVDPLAEAINRLQVDAAGEQARRRRPHQGEVDFRRIADALGAGAKIEIGDMGAERLFPIARRVVIVGIK